MPVTMGAATIATAKGLFVARKSRLAGIAASLLAAGLALSGCSMHPGAAAVVDGQRISERALAESADALQPFLQSQLTPTAMLSSMIQAPVLLDVAAEHGFAASSEDAANYLDSIAEQAQIEAPETYPEGTLDVARMSIVTQKFSTGEGDADGIQEEFTQRVAELDVSVNPRYGDWDAQATSGSFIAQTTPDWLIAPADDAQAAG